jgi:hypothetical protein
MGGNLAGRSNHDFNHSAIQQNNAGNLAGWLRRSVTSHVTVEKEPPVAKEISLMNWKRQPSLKIAYFAFFGRGEGGKFSEFSVGTTFVICDVTFLTGIWC